MGGGIMRRKCGVGCSIHTDALWQGSSRWAFQCLLWRFDILPAVALDVWLYGSIELAHGRPLSFYLGATPSTPDAAPTYPRPSSSKLFDGLLRHGLTPVSAASAGAQRG